MFSSKNLRIKIQVLIMNHRQLKLLEDAAIPRRREVLEVEVRRQRIREETLQKQYADAQFAIQAQTGQINAEQQEAI